MPPTVPTDFGSDLRNLIADPRHGLLIDARQRVDADGREVRVDDGAFVRDNGKFQRQYLTLWGLFNDSALLTRCVDDLQRLAEETGGSITTMQLRLLAPPAEF
jgi:hypothetical protein